MSAASLEELRSLLVVICSTNNNNSFSDSMQHPFGALTRNFRLIRLRKLRGQQPAGPAGDGETRVVSAKCLMSLNGYLLRPRGTSPPCFSFTRFMVEQCSLKKTSI